MLCDINMEEFEERLKILRRGGEIHREIRQWVKPQLKKGIKLYDLANSIEDRIREATGYDPENPLAAGVGFPTGLSVNNCAAHWTPHYNSTETLKDSDLIKIDFGVQFNGHIIDAAFTHTNDPKLQPLIDATFEATTAATKAAGPDAILGEIGHITEEVISSFEFDGRPLRSIGDLSGHNIGPYRIHNNKAVPNISIPRYRERMEVGEIFAIETFPSSGTGHVREVAKDNTHFMINYSDPQWKNIRPKKNKDKKILEFIIQDRSTLAFCPRWYSKRNNYKQFLEGLDNLVKRKIINTYPPLYDKPGSYVAQFEQTIAIKENGIEILS